MPKVSPTTLSTGPGNNAFVESQSPENQALTLPATDACLANAPIANEAGVEQYRVPPTLDRVSNLPDDVQNSFLQRKDGQFFISNIPPRRFTQPIAQGSVLKTLQVWEGTVTGLLDDENFIATLRDLTKTSNPDEQAEFARVEVSEDDLELLTPGSTFYWIVGTESTPGGQKKKISTLQFRRLPRWTDNVLRRANERAALTRSLFRPQE